MLLTFFPSSGENIKSKPYFSGLCMISVFLFPSSLTVGKLSYSGVTKIHYFFFPKLLEEHVVFSQLAFLN